MQSIFSHRLEVRFRDCDPLGHVNNAVYLTYLEHARLMLWRAVWGFNLGDAGVDGPGVILARVEIDYKRPARYGDVLDVRISLAGIGRTSFRYDYEILDQQERLVATAKSVQVIYDYQAGKPVPMPDSIREKLMPSV